MKLDMGGSAAVFGAAKALGQIKPLGVEVLHFSQPHSCMRCRGFTHISLPAFGLPSHNALSVSVYYACFLIGEGRTIAPSPPP